MYGFAAGELAALPFGIKANECVEHHGSSGSFSIVSHGNLALLQAHMAGEISGKQA